MNKVLQKTYLSIIAAWLFLTVFVDFFVIPTAFRQLGDIFIAGELGIRVFSALNVFEIIFSVIFLVYSFVSRLRQKLCILHLILYRLDVLFVTLRLVFGV